LAPGPSATATRHLRTLFALGAAGSLTDAELLGRFATHGGEAGELAFALLVERHGPTVLRVARCHLPDETSAHDAFQATFLILARKARSLRVADSLGPWLREVARRVASQARRAEARRRIHERGAARPEAAPARDPSLPDLSRAIGQEVERLPTPYRLAVVACHLEGLTQHEAAGRLGWKLGTLQSRLDRGRRRLRDALRRRGLAPSLAPLALQFDAVPPALAASTAKAAGALQGGKTAAGVITPAVLAMIEATTKGMLMMKLKLGALALVMLGGVVGSGVGLGVGRPVKATDASGQVKPGELARGDSPTPPPPKPDPGVIFEEVDLDGDGKPEVLTRSLGGAIPMPADGPGFPYLLEFYESMSVVGLKHHQDVATLVGLGYPIKSVDVGPIGKDGIRIARPLTDRYQVNAYPTLVLVDGVGDEIARSPGLALANPLKIAQFYNENRSKPARRPPVVAPPVDLIREEAEVPHLGKVMEGEDRPTLLFFTAPWAGPSRQMRPEVEKLARKGYPIRQVDIDQSPEVRSRYQVTAVPTFVVVDARGKELARTQGVIPADKLAAFYNKAKAREADSATGDVEPSLGEAPPRPWETVVRIKVHLSDGEWGFGSGTIISSTAEESIILTCAHIFRLKDRAQPLPRNFRVPISVDLFGGQFVRQQPATLACSEKDLPGEAIDYDFTHDVGLIRIRPGRKLPASQVVPTTWKPKVGMTMLTLGCSHGQVATAWSTTILEPRFGMMNTGTKQSFAMIKCAHQPKEGRAGGGLYTPDGHVAGVCAFADPKEHVGLYAVPEAIHKLLERNGLARLVRREEEAAPDDFDGSMVEETPKAVPVPGLVADEPEFDPGTKSVRRRPATDRDPAPDERPLLVPQPEPEPARRRPSTDQDRRIDELERKLDRILKALESPKAVPPDASGNSTNRQ